MEATAVTNSGAPRAPSVGLGGNFIAKKQLPDQLTFPAAQGGRVAVPSRLSPNTGPPPPVTLTSPVTTSSKPGASELQTIKPLGTVNLPDNYAGIGATSTSTLAKGTPPSGLTGGIKTGVTPQGNRPIPPSGKPAASNRPTQADVAANQPLTSASGSTPASATSVPVLPPPPSAGTLDGKLIKLDAVPTPKPIPVEIKASGSGTIVTPPVAAPGSFRPPAVKWDAVGGNPGYQGANGVKLTYKSTLEQAAANNRAMCSDGRLRIIGSETPAGVTFLK
jgi:hypothetical protein